MHPSSFYLIHSFFLHWLLYILVVLYAVSFWLAELITCSHPDGWLLQIFSWRVVLWVHNSKDHSGIFQPLGGPTWFLGADEALKGLFHPFFHCWTNFLSMWSFGLLLPALIPQIYCYNIHYYNIHFVFSNHRFCFKVGWHFEMWLIIANAFCARVAILNWPT